MIEVVTYDDSKRTSFDWGTYSILRFNAVPGSITVHVMDRPGQPFLGAGETAQGPPPRSPTPWPTPRPLAFAICRSRLRR